jgi:WD40 repeat protein
MDASATAVVLGDEVHGVRTSSVDLSRMVPLPTSTPSSVGNARAVAIAPDGSKVAFARVDEIPVHDPPGVMPGPGISYRFFVRVASVSDGEEQDVFPGDPEVLAFSPDSASLAVAGDARLRVRTLATKEMRVLDAKVSFPRRIAWSPDKQELALADWRGAIRLYDLRLGGRLPRVLRR